jgi:hypothetical protein
MEQDAKQQTLVDVPEGWKAGEFVIMAGRSGTIKEIKGQRVCVKHHDDGGYERWYDLSDLPEKDAKVADLASPAPPAETNGAPVEKPIFSGSTVRITVGPLKGETGVTRKLVEENGDKWEVLSSKGDVWKISPKCLEVIDPDEERYQALIARNRELQAEMEEVKQERARLIAQVDALQQREAVEVAQYPVEEWEVARLVHDELRGDEFDQDVNDEFAGYLNDGWEIVSIDAFVYVIHERPNRGQIITLRRRVQVTPDDGEKVTAVESSVDAAMSIDDALEYLEPDPQESEQPEPMQTVAGDRMIFPDERPEPRSQFEQALRTPGLSAAQIGQIGDQEIIQMVLGQRKARVPRALDMLMQGSG